jgi:hypothetical protein
MLGTICTINPSTNIKKKLVDKLHLAFRSEFIHTVQLKKKYTNNIHTGILYNFSNSDYATPFYPQKLILNFIDKWRSLSWYSSLAD